jgi:uncharacterized protein YjbJ (UPF0337 family)
MIDILSRKMTPLAVVVQGLIEEMRRSAMASGTLDEVKGQAKEAAGALTGDKELQAEGKMDQAVGDIKNAVKKVKDKAEDVIDDVKDTLS